MVYTLRTVVFLWEDTGILRAIHPGRNFYYYKIIVTVVIIVVVVADLKSNKDMQYT